MNSNPLKLFKLSFLFILLISFAPMKAQNWLPFTVDLEQSDSYFLAWNPIEESPDQSIEYELQIISESDGTILQTYSTTQKWMAFPDKYKNNPNAYYQVQGKSNGQIILTSDIQPLCVGCNWEVRQQWICDGRDYAYKIKELKRATSDEYYYSISGVSNPLTHSNKYEAFSAVQPYGSYSYYPAHVGPRPFFNKTGGGIADHLIAYGKPQPVGPSSGGSWGATGTTNYLIDGLPIGTSINFAISRFNTYRKTTTSTSNPNIPLECIKYPRRAAGGGGGVIGTPIGDLAANPREPSTLDVHTHTLCYKNVPRICWKYDEDGQRVYYVCYDRVRVPCDNQVAPVVIEGLSATDIIGSYLQPTDFDEDGINDVVDYVIIHSLQGDDHSPVYFKSDMSLEDVNPNLLPNGVYRTTVGYNNSENTFGFFIINGSDQPADEVSFEVSIFPVPNDGNYSLKINSTQEKNFSYRVYDINGVELYQTNTGMITDDILTINLNLADAPPSNQLIHKIADENGNEVTINTIYNP